MIEYSHMSFEVTCDFCPYCEEFELDRNEWKLLILVMKEDGWRFSKEGDGWIHCCPSCVGKRPARNRGYRHGG